MHPLLDQADELAALVAEPADLTDRDGRRSRLGFRVVVLQAGVVEYAESLPAAAGGEVRGVVTELRICVSGAGNGDSRAPGVA